MDRLDFLLQYLIRENPQYSEMQIPSDLHDKRDLFRALRNVRPPKPVGEKFLRLQDEELQAQLAEKGVVKLDAVQQLSFFKSQFSISLWQGDITRLQTDAIVNAANAQGLGCWHPLHRCIDNAIHSAAGVQLRAECHATLQGGTIGTGQAIITKGYNLPAKHVIHTVGPIVATGVPSAEQEQQLAQCYRSCLQLAVDNSCHSIAFCCISTGEFRFPNRRAAEIAVQTATHFLAYNNAPMQVVFNVFKHTDLDIYQNILSTH